MSTEEDIPQDSNMRTIQIHIIPDKKKKPKQKVITIITNREKPKRKPRKPRDETIRMLELKRKKVIQEKEKIERLLKLKKARSTKSNAKGTILLNVDPTKTIPLLLNNALVVKVDPSKKIVPLVSSYGDDSADGASSSSRVIRSEFEEADKNDDLFETCSDWTKWIKNDQENGQDEK